MCYCYSDQIAPQRNFQHVPSEKEIKLHIKPQLANGLVLKCFSVECGLFDYLVLFQILDARSMFNRKLGKTCKYVWPTPIYWLKFRVFVSIWPLLVNENIVQCLLDFFYFPYPIFMFLREMTQVNSSALVNRRLFGRLENEPQDFPTLIFVLKEWGWSYVDSCSLPINKRKRIPT